MKTSWWADITRDSTTNHVIAKDLFKAIAFFVGLGIVLFAAYADYDAGREVRLDGAVLLLSYALGLAVSKAVEGYYNRRTSDDTGSPLVQPGTAEKPNTPVVMPQPAIIPPVSE